MGGKGVNDIVVNPVFMEMEMEMEKNKADEQMNKCQYFEQIEGGSFQISRLMEICQIMEQQQLKKYEEQILEMLTFLYVVHQC